MTIQVKFCKRCKKDKVIIEFITNKEYKQCNECREKKRNYHKTNPEVCKRGYQKYISKEENRLKKNQREKKRRQTGEYKKYSSEYRKEYSKRDYVKERRRKYRSNRKNTDLGYKVINSLRSRINTFIKYKKLEKNKSIIGELEEILGCCRDFIQDWIKYNITIDNLEDYQIDHVRPLSRFFISCFEDIQKTNCNHWTNLLPISSLENNIKNNRNPTKKELFKLDLRVYLFCKKNKKKYEKIIFSNYICN